MDKKCKDGIYIGKEDTDEKVVFEEYKPQNFKNLELGKIGYGSYMDFDN